MSRFITAAASIGTAIGGNELLTRNITIDYVGVPANVLVACIFGTFAGFGFSDRLDSIPRRRQVQLFIGCVLMGCAFTGTVDWLVGELTDMEVKPGVLASMGAILSCVMPTLIPEILKRLGPWLDRIPFLKPKQDDAP